MPPAKHKVDVVIPCYNTERFVAEAIRSVLEQDIDGLHLIVVNDGSTDASAQIIAGFSDDRLTVIEQANRGLAEARNAGIRRGEGQYLKVLDADDYLLPGALRAQVEFLDHHPEVGACVGNFMTVDEEGVTLEVAKRPPGTLETGDLLIRNRFPPHVPLFRRSSMATFDYYDQSVAAAADWDFHCRLALSGCRFWQIADPICAYRKVGGSMSSNPRKQTEPTLAVVEKVFALEQARPFRAELEPLARWHAFTSGAIRAFIAGEEALGREYLNAGLLALNQEDAGNLISQWVDRMIVWTRFLPESEVPTYLAHAFSGTPDAFRRYVKSTEYLQFLYHKEAVFNNWRRGQKAGAARHSLALLGRHPIQLLQYYSRRFR